MRTIEIEERLLRTRADLELVWIRVPTVAGRAPKLERETSTAIRTTSLLVFYAPRAAQRV